jgi:hypothetical protein
MVKCFKEKALLRYKKFLQKVWLDGNVEYGEGLYESKNSKAVVMDIDS